MAHVFSPAEHYREADILMQRRHGDCPPDCPPNCAHEQAAVAAAAVHATLATARGRVAELAAKLGV